MNRIIVIAVILGTVFLSGCVQSDLTNINDMSLSVNSHLKKGDEYYNLSATNTNKLILNQALTDNKNADNEYSQAQASAQTALTSAKNLNDGIYIDYIQNALLEIQAKLNATSELQTAINLLQNNQTSSANVHLGAANEFMNKSLVYKKNREDIVKQNPNKFK
ncbi:MAG: hypothetical protein LUQ24_03680 [Methanobacterium sp.]|jgi:hypothetical protein|nr:hypothetical protein [Methanobacterium sp.]